LGVEGWGLRVEGWGLESSWLKSPGLKGLGLKLGVEKSGFEMSFNPSNCLIIFWQMTDNSQKNCETAT
jgi:hypothetical protein